jgi:two-component system invasion response regulator UvrY
VCRVLIVDDHEIVREGLVGLFQFETDIEIVGEAADGPGAIELVEKLKPDVVVMDVNLGEMSGVEATKRILEANPEIKVVGLSMHVDKNVAAAMHEAGAAAYLPKTGLSEDLVAAIRACYKS